MARPNNAAAIARHVQGLREAKAAFQALPEITRDRLLHATETTLKEIQRGAQARLRSSPAIRTRALHDHVKWALNKKSGRGRVGIATGTSVLIVPHRFSDGQMGQRRVRVKGIITAGRGGSALTSKGARRVQPTRYAHLIEFGARHAPAEPFMLPSAKSQEQPYAQRARGAGKGIEQDMSRVGGRFL